MAFDDRPLLIGVSARIYYPATPVFDLGGVWTKTLHYLEQSVAHWLMRGGALPVMVPAVDAESAIASEYIDLAHYAQALDGLLLQGGNDVAPQTYGDTPLRPEWSGDPKRDSYEIDLVNAFVDAGKPVFGICRGLQLLNVAFGGTLWQDLGEQHPQALAHVNRDRYERNLHDVEIVPGTRLAEMYAGRLSGRINSIHHQAIRRLADDFVAEAHSPHDGIVEAIRLRGERWVAAVQWHPEFHPLVEARTFDDGPMLADFLAEARRRREAT